MTSSSSARPPSGMQMASNEIPFRAGIYNSNDRRCSCAMADLCQAGALLRPITATPCATAASKEACVPNQALVVGAWPEADSSATTEQTLRRKALRHPGLIMSEMASSAWQTPARHGLPNGSHPTSEIVSPKFLPEPCRSHNMGRDSRRGTKATTNKRADHKAMVAMGLPTPTQIANS